MSPATLDLSQFDLASLIDGCVENLRAVYDESLGLFPYSTLVVDGRFINDYSHPQTIRYTINTLLGLSEAARVGAGGVNQHEVDAMVATFLDRQVTRVQTCADSGLLLLLLCDYGDPESPIVADKINRLEGVVTGRTPDGLNMQDLAWTLWGACAAARSNTPQASRLASKAFALATSEFFDADSGLPRHTNHLYRRNIVSFGSLVYFLRAVHEYAARFADERAEEIFLNGVQRAIDLQGPAGEWPWMIGVHSGRTLDAYPVFSVHQDSMAMLFLLPANDRAAPRTSVAIKKSLAWSFGGNELSIDFYLSNPFYAFRSIERSEKAPRMRRYLRSRARVVARRPATTGGASVRLNPECRSYHLGWILYVWASRPEANARTVLETR